MIARHYWKVGGASSVVNSCSRFSQAEGPSGLSIPPASTPSPSSRPEPAWPSAHKPQLRGGLQTMPRTVSCFTNACGASGVWTAVERVREAGINHLELALRPHNFGGLVIPESAVITEQADEATARSFVDHPDRCGVTISGCNIGGADLRTTRSTKIGMR